MPQSKDKEKIMVLEWKRLKEQETEIAEKRKALEEQLLRLKGLSRELESSTELYRDDHIYLVAKPNLSYKVDSAEIDKRLKQDPSFGEVVELFFRRKYELSVTAYKASNPELTEKILPYVSVSYIRPTFQVHEVGGEK